MNNIQQLISELEVEKEKSERFISMHRYCGGTVCDRENQKLEDFSLFIQKLKLLLKDESKQPQPPDFANTMLGEVPPVVNNGTKENSQAVEGATPVVRQNEQTKEVCPYCLSGEIWHNWEFSRCDECNHTW